MDDSIQPVQWRLTILHYVAWFFFGCGILSPALVFAIAGHASNPGWNWETSFFGQHLAVPLWILGFLCCAASPHFTQLSRLWKVMTMLMGIGAFGIVFVISLIVSLFVFGTGIVC